MADFTHLETTRERAISLIRDIFIAAEAVPRERDQRKYRSQCMYWFHLYELGDGKDRYESMDYFKLQAAIYELTKLQRKLITFWFYPGRHISYAEALLEFQYETTNYPKFKPRVGMASVKSLGKASSDELK